MEKVGHGNYIIVSGTTGKWNWACFKCKVWEHGLTDAQFQSTTVSYGLAYHLNTYHGFENAP